MSTNVMAPAARAALNTRIAGSTSEGPSAAAGHEETVTVPTKARRGRRLGRIGRIAAVGAVALVLAGTAAGHADAMRRQSAVMEVNGYIGTCFSTGGESFIYEDPGSFNFVCVYEDGGIWEYDIFYAD
jgi:hypothetical protein